MSPDDRLLGVRPFRVADDGRTLHLLDQRALPTEERWLELREIEPLAQAIETLAVRGAPAIACVAALGLAIAARGWGDDPIALRRQVSAALDRLAHTRPTAVNLFVALRELADALASLPADADAGQIRARLREVADQHVARELASCLAMAEHGAPLLPDAGGVLTHCNTGALATAGVGTALGVIRRAHALGKRIRVFADETRPVLQGARLTAWELHRDGIPVEVIADNMAGFLMARGEVQAAIVGADRIAANGDVANKIGTYTVAVLCHHHRIPFYVAAPWTTIDPAIAAGAAIPIEERDATELTTLAGRRIAPAGVGARNPAFDVTPHGLVTGFVTDVGVLQPPFDAAVKRSRVPGR
ncbi:MAG: S-methyl-5-thioribose-1-phosphate isomerase [Myxococcales bacterium]|nr:S-methyl-5-thioribose-1-phosphate isomerase [Myxococcales bacterium]